MKLLIFAERFPPDIGGVSASCRRIAESISLLGHEVDVFVLCTGLHAGAVSTETLSDRLTIHRFGRSRNVDFTLQHALNFLEWLHRKRGFETVWSHYAGATGFLGVWFGKLMELPSVLSVRGNDLDRQLFPPGDLARLQFCLSTCTQVVTVSKDLARKVHALSGRTAVVLPNAVDTAVFQPGEAPQELKAKYQIQPGELVLVFSGELRAKKGLPFLISAFREIQAVRPARLVIIGEVRAKERGEFERAIASAEDARDSMVVTGHLESREEVADHLRLGDIFLMPSLWDGMPNSVLEAMATGIPVIASDAGAIPELLIDGESGLLVPKTHLHLLSQSIDELLAMSDSARRSLINTALQIVRDCHTSEVERRLLAQVFSELESKES